MMWLVLVMSLQPYPLHAGGSSPPRFQHIKLLFSFVPFFFSEYFISFCCFFIKSRMDDTFELNHPYRIQNWDNINQQIIQDDSSSSSYYYYYYYYYSHYYYLCSYTIHDIIWPYAYLISYVPHSIQYN